MKLKWIALGALALIAIAGYLALPYFFPPALGGAGEVSLEQPDPFGDSADELVFLNQGWTEDERNWFYTVSQGSWIVPYSWWLVLEDADSEQLFGRDDAIRRWRYVPSPPNSRNPDGLPIGFVKDEDNDWMGFTCAACHTAQFTYQGTAVRIDGGPSLGDSPTMMTQLGASLQATLDGAAKFDRFAVNVLGDRSSDAAAIAELREYLSRVSASTAGFNERSHTTVPWGYGRVDAIGTIFNEVTARDLEIPENRREPDAPVSYPFIWDTPQHDRVQWNGALANAGLGSLARNVGEVLGVWGNVTIDPAPGKIGYESTVRAMNLLQIEESVRKLVSPRWSETPLPPVDQELAALGKPLYEANCTNCHVLLEGDERISPRRRIKAHMVPVDTVGTDPTASMNFERRAKTGRLAGTKLLLHMGEELGEEASAFYLLANASLGVIFEHPVAALGTAIDREKMSILDIGHLESLAPNLTVPEPPSYKARPLNGVWATAPYLHNGSVPNLTDLLRAPEERATIFYVGHREFDPVSVGYVNEDFEGAFTFDTTLRGKSNAGHNYGTGLTEEEKRQLIEYLKTL